MNWRKTLLWMVILGMIVTVGTGCRNKRTAGEAHWRMVAKQLDEKASRLALENTLYKAKLNESEIELDELRKIAGVWENLSDDLKARLLALMEHGGITPTKGGFKMDDTVLFKPGYYEVRAEGKALLQKVADALSNEDVVLRIDGHTDSDKVVKAKQRGIKDNLHLSAMRAHEVARVLIAQGIDSNRVFIAGFGENWPIADNSSKAGKTQNRRVEFVIMPPRGVMLPSGEITTEPAAFEPPANIEPLPAE